MADKDRTDQSPQTSNLEAEATKNIDENDEFNKESDTEESKMDDSQEQGFLGKIYSPNSKLNLYNAIRKGNQDAVKRRSGTMTSSAQLERSNLEIIRPKIDSAQEYGGIKRLTRSAQYGDLYGSDEGEDSGNKGLGLDTDEEEEATLTGYSGDIDEEAEEESKEDDSNEEGSLAAENIEESDPNFNELLQTLENDTETSEKEQEKGSEGFVVKKKITLLERLAYSSSNDLEQEEGSDAVGDISTNMEGLEEVMREFGCKDESYRLENENDGVKLTNEAEKDQHRTKKGITEWLRGYVELDEDWETVKEIKAEVVKLAIVGSHLLVNLMFSLPKIDLVDTMFQGFLNSLKDQYIDENSKVIHRIFILLEFAYEEVKKLKTLKEDVDALEEYSDTDQNDEFRGSELRERLFEENQVDELIIQFLNPILCLENILLREGEPDREILVKELLSALKHELKECEEELKRLASRTNELKAEYGCILGPQEQNIYEMMKSKINELWNQELESEETKTKAVWLRLIARICCLNLE